MKTKKIFNIIFIILVVILLAGYIRSVFHENYLRTFQKDAEQLATNIINAETIDQHYDVHVLIYDEESVAIWLSFNDKAAISEAQYLKIYQDVENAFKNFEFKDKKLTKARIIVSDKNHDGSNSDNEPNFEIISK